MKFKYTLPMIAFSSFVYGQTSVNSSGGNISNASGSVSFSIGQVAYNNASNTNGSVSQGVQQVFEISSLGLEENTLNLSLNVYPNPTQEQLTLRVGNYSNEKLTYMLIDTQGKVLGQGNINSQETKMEMYQLPVGTYFVNVNQENKKIQTFKIIKNQ